MGATEALGTLVSAKQSNHHWLGEHRLYANLGPLGTIIRGPSGPTQKMAHAQLWFRDGQFLFTHSPFTKE